MIPIFDSLSHPTLNKNWILPKYAGASAIETLIEQMKEANIKKSLAVGMKGIGGYDPCNVTDRIVNQLLSLQLPYTIKVILGD